MALKCIPLNPEWTNDTKHDLFAIYLRRKQDNWGTPELDSAGREQWDATGPLPMRRHDDWTKKGFQYLTIYTARDSNHWPMVARWIRDMTGEDPETYIQNRRERSTFDVRLWLMGAETERDRELAALKAEIDEFGPDVVLKIRRRLDPNFVIPPSLLAPTVSDITDEPDPTPAPKRGPGRPRTTGVAA